jgi:hypothetical protein
MIKIFVFCKLLLPMHWSKATKQHFVGFERGKMSERLQKMMLML